MIFLVVIFLGHGHMVFGKEFNISLMLNLNQMELKMHISQCLYQEESFKFKKIMFKVFLHKLLGLLNQVNPIWLNQLQLDLQVRLLCIQLMLIGLRAIEIYH